MGRLVAGVAHEVRNPLFAITAVLDAFELELGSQEGFLDYGLRLRREVSRMTRLMQDLLDYGRPTPVELRRGVLPPVLEQALDACRARAEVQEVRLELAVSGGLPELDLDEGRLQQVFQNLIQNAIEHSPRGGQVDVIASGVEGGIECQVRDRGPGLAHADLEHLFEPFYSRRRGGTGLGLALVQRFVEEHGGRVTASNAAGGGAQLTVWLPEGRPPGP